MKLTKLCRTCDKKKGTDRFYTFVVKGRSYFQSRCKRCAKKQAYERTKGLRADQKFEMLLAARRRAKKRGTLFSITREDICIPEVCPILGIKLYRKKGKGPGANSPSLDEIIAGGGYVPGNIQVISNKANNMKSNGSLEELVKLGKWAQEILTKIRLTNCK